MAERGYRNLNASVLRQISKALEHDPAADIEAVLNKLYTSYANLRRSVGARQVKQRIASDRDDNDDLPADIPPSKRPRLALPGALLSLASAIQSQQIAFKPHPLEHQELNPSISFACSLPHTIIHPLSPVVCDLLSTMDDCSSDLSSMVVRRVLSGTSIWESHSRAVIRVGENVVVKVAQNLDHDEHGVLQFLKDHIPDIAAPRALGLVTVGSTSFMFMTLIPGATLESRWSSLSADAKKHIRSALDGILIALRKLEHPNGTQFGSPVGRRVCKDVRRDERVSASPIFSEIQFNDFLLHSPSSRATPGYKKWLRSMLRVDHRIVFTHSDFHPRNVMIVGGPRGSIELSGIIDWEASGFYPEYWELLKGMNTRSVKDTSDWWDYLPQCIQGYNHEIVLDRVIESTIIY